METTVIDVKGMTCMGCVRSVKNVLEPIHGVGSVEVSLEAGKVTVSYDLDHVKLDTLKAAIQDAGYDVVG
jgi:copper chaperone